jgi:hypothetical protein
MFWCSRTINERLYDRSSETSRVIASAHCEAKDYGEGTGVTYDIPYKSIRYTQVGLSADIKACVNRIDVYQQV